MVEQLPRAHGAAYQLRLEDVTAKNGKLFAVCFICKNVQPLDIEKILTRHAKYERLVVIEDRLRCAKCGAKGKVSCAFRVEWGELHTPSGAGNQTAI